MLVLRRRCGERITIGNDITIEVVRITATRVDLGITAPRDIQVHRAEIYDAIEAGIPLTKEKERG